MKALPHVWGGGRESTRRRWPSFQESSVRSGEHGGDYKRRSGVRLFKYILLTATSISL